MSSRKEISMPSKFTHSYSNTSASSTTQDKDEVGDVPSRPQSPTPAPVVHTRGRDRRMEKTQVVNPTPVPKPVSLGPPESQTITQVSTSKPELIHRRDYITEEEAKRWVKPNARKPGEHFKTWGKRLVQKWKEPDLGDCDSPEDLNQCMQLCHDLEQYDPKAVRPPMKEELEKYEKIA